MAQGNGEKGYDFEEALRNYFLKSNFYVLRSLPLQIEGEDITDIDIWLYERSSGFSRRRSIVDAKFKMRPKAAERFLWTKGLSQFLKVDACYVATTDNRPVVRELSRQMNVGVFDGNDLSRIASNEKVEFPNRLTGEKFESIIREAQAEKASRLYTSKLVDAKSSIISSFGVHSANYCLSCFSYFAEEAINSYPNSLQAEASVRAALWVASMAAISLDYIASEAAFRTLEERKKVIANGLRYGNTDSYVGQEKVRVAAALVEQFAENGSAIARQVSFRFQDEIESIPAEIVADQVARMSTKESLFAVSRDLEERAHSRVGFNFESLSADSKGLIGSFLDFSGLSRAKFANAYTGQQSVQKNGERVVEEQSPRPIGEIKTSELFETLVEQGNEPQSKPKRKRGHIKK